ncbi:MAG TPA: hypothetical protein GXX53_06915 [Tissierellia bacterium]|nr:hypothetical protein [Tissierellia bacterium]
MDWSKAKTILIIAFIITNVFIVFLLLSDRPIEEPTITDKFISNVKELLKDKNIYIEASIPREIAYLNSMIVEFEKADSQSLNRLYFDNNGVIHSDGSLKEITYGMESILIINNRLIIYENNDEKARYNLLNIDDAIEIAEDFLMKGNFSTSDMKLTYSKQENNVFYLEYSKVYEDTYIERAYTNFQIDERGVKRFERLWLNAKEIGDTKIYISTAPKSLLNLLGMQEVYNNTITDISLCYYFDPEKHEYIEEPGEAKQGKAVPAWRIQFEDGYKVYIDEY